MFHLSILEKGHPNIGQSCNLAKLHDDDTISPKYRKLASWREFHLSILEFSDSHSPKIEAHARNESCILRMHVLVHTCTCIVKNNLYNLWYNMNCLDSNPRPWAWLERMRNTLDRSTTTARCNWFLSKLFFWLFQSLRLDPLMFYVQ